MSKRKKRGTRTIGQVPGFLEAPPDAHATHVRGFTYRGDKLKEWTGLDAVPTAEKAAGSVVWVDVVGLESISTVEALGARFGLHKLALEDVVHVTQRPKVEPYGDHLYVVARMARLIEGMVDIEQVSIFVGAGFVLTFQEREGDCFEMVRKRLRDGRGKLRTTDADYLGYALLDAIVDSAFPVVEALADRLEVLEDLIFEDPTVEILERVHKVKRELVVLRRAMWPLREAISNMHRGDLPGVGEEVRLFLRDCHDHAVQVVELVDGQRELASSLLDAYLSSVGYRQNEVMKVLTMIATIFIPLSFMVGLYGMNFDTNSPYNMPELSSRYGYVALVSVMLTISCGMLVFFRRKKWL